MSDWPGVDPFAWTWLHPRTREQFAAERVSYLVCETMDGAPFAWAPLGSAKPSAIGEGTDWRIRTVRNDGVELLDTAEECARWLVRYGVTPRQIRDWARRGRIARHGDRYVMQEIANYLDNRPDADKRRAAARSTCNSQG